MTAASFWWVNTVTVETYLGDGAFGPRYADPVEVNCWLENGNNLVRDATGMEVVSSAAVHGPLEQAQAFTPESRVTTTDGRTTHVIVCREFDSGSLNLLVDHFEASLK